MCCKMNPKTNSRSHQINEIGENVLTWDLLCNVSETESEYRVSSAISGVEHQNINVSVENNRLAIRIVKDKP